MSKQVTQVRLLLGDQLNANHSWFEQVEPETLYVLCELRSETDYVCHHIQKIVGFFLSMRCFARELEEAGHRVHYLRLDDPDNTQSFSGNIQCLLEQTGATSFGYQLPDEYRLDQELKALAASLSEEGCEIEVCDTEHFLSEREELASFFEGKKTYLMESFYRYMRKKYDIMMEDGEPLSGRWNYDAENRKKLKKGEVVPEPLCFAHDVSDIVALLEDEGVSFFGEIDPKAFLWPVSRAESLALLDAFVEHFLPQFGMYQDTMSEVHWSLFHSRLSFSMNTKMLHPLEVIEAALAAWEQRHEQIDIAQIEGFIRQILGWREFMRGVYWAHMPDYATMNHFGHTRSLPAFFWTGKTKMSCLAHAIGQSLTYAYAHHIQRLMITGNFALLAGIDPDQVDAWYLGIYIDAIEWVEITNTRGMSQFADGGIVGTKPYVSSANYINKMSHYCKDCSYDQKKRHGQDACPFNSLYWHFFETHRDKLSNNPRIGMAYRNLNRMSPEEHERTIKQATHYLEHLDTL